MSPNGPAIRERLYGCNSQSDKTCGSCLHFERQDNGATTCSWIRSIQISRGVQKIDDHVTQGQKACAGYKDRLQAVPRSEPLAIRVNAQASR